MDAVGREPRHAARGLVRSPAFTLAAVLTLALAGGANAAIFTVVYRVGLNPLPYPDSDRLIALDYGLPARNINSGVKYMSAQFYYQLADRARTLEAVAVYNMAGGTPPGAGRQSRAHSDIPRDAVAVVGAACAASPRPLVYQPGRHTR